MKYDVLVAGGGLSGCCAAISAARHGMRVLLIERYGFLGGMATVGLVNPFMPFSTYEKDGTPLIVNNAGIFGEILQNLSERDGLIDTSGTDMQNAWGGREIKHETRHTFNEEILKLILIEMLEDAGVDLLFHSFVFKIQSKNSKIVSVSSCGKSGVLEHFAEFFIDATGDADLCYLAGCGYEIGREDGKCQPMTLCFRIGNIDPVIAEEIIHDRTARDKINKKYNELQESGDILNKRENVLIFQNVANGTIHFNSTRVIGRNPVDPYDLTEAEKEARKQADELVRFFRNHVPGFKNCILLQTAPQIGIRESRRIVGHYRLSENDLIECRKFGDSIARGCYPVDIHSPDGSGTRIRKIPAGHYYTIPYRSIVPEVFDNLLVAGRPVSSSHEAHSAVRIMPICANIGEAAGIAACLSVTGKIKQKDIDIEKLRKMLDDDNSVY